MFDAAVSSCAFRAAEGLVAFQIMKTLHPAAAGPFYSPCVSSLLFKHSVKTLSQEVRAWRREREMCVCVSHSPKNITIFLLFALPGYTDLWVRASAGEVWRQPAFGGNPVIWPGEDVCQGGDRSRRGGRRLWWNRLGATGQVGRQEKTGRGSTWSRDSSTSQAQNKMAAFCSLCFTEAESRKLFLISSKAVNLRLYKDPETLKEYIFILHMRYETHVHKLLSRANKMWLYFILYWSYLAVSI